MKYNVQAMQKYEAAMQATVPPLHKAEREYFDAQGTEHEKSKHDALNAAFEEACAAARRAGQVLREEFPELFEGMEVSA